MKLPKSLQATAMPLFNHSSAKVQSCAAPHIPIFLFLSMQLSKKHTLASSRCVERQPGSQLFTCTLCMIVMKIIPLGRMPVEILLHNLIVKSTAQTLSHPTKCTSDTRQRQSSAKYKATMLKTLAKKPKWLACLVTSTRSPATHIL